MPECARILTIPHFGRIMKSIKTGREAAEVGLTGEEVKVLGSV